MESHVKTTADGHYTASVYSSLDLDFYIFFVSAVSLLRAFLFPAVSAYMPLLFILYKSIYISN